MQTSSQNKTVAQQLVERVFTNDKENGNCQVIKEKNKTLSSIQVVYQPRSRRIEEHFSQYFY